MVEPTVTVTCMAGVVVSPANVYSVTDTPKDGCSVSPLVRVTLALSSVVAVRPFGVVSMVRSRVSVPSLPRPSVSLPIFQTRLAFR